MLESSQSAHLDRQLQEQRVSVRVAGVVIDQGQLLVQQPSDDPSSPSALPGGHYEVGDTLEGRLRQEFLEETTAQVVRLRYLFVVENRFAWKGHLIQSLEHYFAATIDRDEVETRESHLAFSWTPIDTLAELDLRPHVVRNVIAGVRLDAHRHLIEGAER